MAALIRAILARCARSSCPASPRHASAPVIGASALASLSSSSRARALLRRGCQRPRSIASANRCAISRKRRRVVLGDEAAHRLVAEIGVEQRIEMVVLDLARGGGEGEQVVDRGGDLERSLVAVPHHAPRSIWGWRRGRARPGRSPPSACARAGIRGANGRRGRSRAGGPTDAARWRRARPRTGSSRRCRAGRARDCPGCAAPARRRAAAAPARRRRPAVDAAAIGVAAPGEPGPGEVAIVLPAALVDQRLQPGAVGAGLAAEDAAPPPAAAPAPPASRPPPAGRPRPGPRPPAGSSASGSSSAGHRAAGIVQQLDLGREGVAEEAGDAQGDVDPRPAEHRERQHLDAGDAAGCRRPRPDGSPSAPAPGRCRRRRCACWRCPRPTAPPAAARCRGAADTARPPARPTASPAARPPASARHGSRPSRSCARSAAPRAARASVRRSAPAPRGARRGRAAGPRARAGRSRRRPAAARARPGPARRAWPSSPARRRVRPRPAGAPAAPAARPCRLRCARRRGARQAPPAAAPPRLAPASAPSGSQPSAEIGRQCPQQRGVAALAGPRGRRSQRHQQVGELAAIRRLGRKRAARRGSAAP